MYYASQVQDLDEGKGKSEARRARRGERERLEKRCRVERGVKQRVKE